MEKQTQTMDNSGSSFPTTDTWRQIILPFETACDYANPFLDVSIKAEFTGPGGQKIIREAYWDGGRNYKIAFAPTAPGMWSWHIGAPEETGLNNMSGQICCKPYTGGLAIYRHGFLKTDPTNAFLTYRDGTPFFWLGDTHWAFAYGERWDESNHPEMKSMFRGMADLRTAQGFTVYQTNLRADFSMDGTPVPYWAQGPEGLLPNVEFYQKELDRRMYYLADCGLVNALGFAWFMSIPDKIPLWKNLARYILARYGALPVVWTLAGEVAGYAPDPMRSRFIDDWRQIALYVEELDSYHNLQTAHYDNHRPFSDYYYNEGWYDFTLNQAGHGDFPISVRDFYDYRLTHPDKPFVEGESLYEFCSTLEENGSRLCTADMVRRVAYTAIQSGACGYTYGAQGIWDNVWEKPETPDPFNTFNRFGIPWYEAVDGIGAVQMGYMRKFYEEEHFETLKPIASSSISPFGISAEIDMFSPLATADIDRKHILVYYNEHTRGGCRIEVPHNMAFHASWFNPQNGERTEHGALLKPADGLLDCPGRTGGGDWVLVLSGIRSSKAS